MTKQAVASTVNAGLTLLYWHVGDRIRKEILQDTRAEYGRLIVVTVSRQLVLEYGNGFTDKNLHRMIQFAEVFPDEQIVVTLSRQLSWSHFLTLFPLKDSLQRDFYAEMCRIEKWSVRGLRNKIDSMLFERTALSKKPELVVKAELETLRKKDQLTPDLVFKDPYVLEFLNLNDRYIEKDLEDAIMRELEQFLLELGGGFCFLARQKRIIIDDEDFHLDLLFFHRDLNRLVAIDLKLGDFKPDHKGQMELYLRWLNKHEKRPGEQPPMGLILCAGKKGERVELLELDRSGIHVAEYLTVLPPKKVLREKLHKAIAHARIKLEQKPEGSSEKNDELAEAKVVLRNLKSEIENIEEIALKYSSEAEWKARKSRHWLHGATETKEALTLEKWLFENLSTTNASQMKATLAVRAWRQWLNEKGHFGAYYVDFSDFTIISPQKDELLPAYLNRITFKTEEKGKGHPLAWRALKSFLAFLRTYYPSEEIAFVEHIFPQKMDFKENTIIRKVHKEVYPISQEMAAELLIDLTSVCLNGRKNAQHVVAECLALCWLCLTASRLRLPITIESIMDIKLTDLHKGRYPTIEIPTLFGNRKIRISKRLANFLSALATIPSKKPRNTILQKPLRSLTRAFEKALQKTTFCVEFGNITFVTLLSPPHQSGRHRYQPK